MSKELHINEFPITPVHPDDDRLKMTSPQRVFEKAIHALRLETDDTVADSVGAAAWSYIDSVQDRAEHAETQLADLARLAKAYRAAREAAPITSEYVLGGCDCAPMCTHCSVCDGRRAEREAVERAPKEARDAMFAFLATLDGAAGGEASADEKGGGG